MTNHELKKALLAKLGIQPQGLSKRVQKKKAEIPMSTAEATYLIAHEEGLRLDRFLSADEVARIRALHTPRYPAVESRPQQHPQRRKSQPPAVKELRFAGEIRVSNPLLPSAKLTEARAMARIYPVLYVLENSIRELIMRVMKNRFGYDWWGTQLTTGKLKNVHQTAAGRMLSEKRHSWHQKRGAHPIDYADISDLETIISAKQEYFVPAIIPDLQWFQNFMKELYPSRNVVCHMNPLDEHNVSDVQLRLKKWERTLKSAAAAIPG